MNYPLNHGAYETEFEEEVITIAEQERFGGMVFFVLW